MKAKSKKYWTNKKVLNRLKLTRKSFPNIITFIQYSAVKMPPKHKINNSLNLIFRLFDRYNINSFKTETIERPLASTSEIEIISNQPFIFNIISHANPGELVESDDKHAPFDQDNWKQRISITNVLYTANVDIRKPTSWTWRLWSWTHLGSRLSA